MACTVLQACLLRGLTFRLQTSALLAFGARCSHTIVIETLIGFSFHSVKLVCGTASVRTSADQHTDKIPSPSFIFIIAMGKSSLHIF